MGGLMGESTDGQPPDPEELAGTLLDAAAATDFAQALDDARASIEAQHDALDPLQRFQYEMIFFDVTMVSTTDSLIRAACAEALLTSAIEAGAPGWEAVRSSSRLDEIERLASESDARLDLLELLAYAPDEGMRGFAVNQIQSAGLQALESGNDSRTFERLLHAIGASADAYRLESVRKQRMPGALGGHELAPTKSRTSVYRQVAIAGGHAQLRMTAATLLQRHGVETVLIPSSLEAVRRERDIVHQLQGCDLAIVLVRQITHSTSDQVRKVAEKLNIPVIFSNSLSAVAIERQLFDSGR
jgi:hypothetical protein